MKLLIVLLEAEQDEVDALVEEIPGGCTWAMAEADIDRPWSELGRETFEPALAALRSYRQRALDARKATR